MLTFNEETHKYYNDGKELISVTTLMKKHKLSPDYSAVSNEILFNAAQRGTLIHKEIEELIKKNSIGFSNECAMFNKEFNNRKYNVLKSEFKVYNDVCAGTLDLIYRDEKLDLVISDIKTTSTLHKEAVSWQLSIYKYLYTRMFPDFEAPSKASVVHFPNDYEIKIVEVPLKADAEVEALFAAERTGTIYQCKELSANEFPVELEFIAEVEKKIIGFKEQISKLEETKTQFIQSMYAAMKNADVKKYEDDNLVITRIDESTRTTVDSAKLKKDFPEIYEQCKKESTTAGTVRIKLK